MIVLLRQVGELGGDLARLEPLGHFRQVAESGPTILKLIYHKRTIVKLTCHIMTFIKLTFVVDRWESWTGNRWATSTPVNK